ncbi:hypothetical protein H072_1668 [Dactylellina haptotyla CBS 200.50]|uniref:Uncharacterized protein n=1 Tax=Dactylellina haptotyla (strain CBS 200.50) TaxID=1284197 RepID=S8BXZ3_DACHA|nr:hypothetical protein H072_1668 [Dactylellina haptotyla CBS 200.50]
MNILQILHLKKKAKDIKAKDTAKSSSKESTPDVTKDASSPPPPTPSATTSSTKDGPAADKPPKSETEGSKIVTQETVAANAMVATSLAPAATSAPHSHDNNTATAGHSEAAIDGGDGGVYSGSGGFHGDAGGVSGDAGDAGAGAAGDAGCGAF